MLLPLRSILALPSCAATVDLFGYLPAVIPAEGSCGLARFVFPDCPATCAARQGAKAVGVSPNRVAEIVNNRRRITADTALRLARFFNMSAQFWLNLQTHYDLEREEERLGKRLEKEVKKLAA